MQTAGTLHSLKPTSQAFLNYKLQSRDNHCNCHITPGDTINAVDLIWAGINLANETKSSLYTFNACWGLFVGCIFHVMKGGSTLSLEA